MRQAMYVMICLSLLVGGCVTANIGAGSGTGAGVGSYSYITGELQATYSVPIEDLWPRAVAAVEGLHLSIDSKYMDSLGARIEARRADGTPVKVQLEPTGERSTTIDVRVGTFGSRDQSERIHTAIQKQLGS
jgi:hypothetical protein